MYSYQTERNDRRRRRQALLLTGLVAVLMMLSLFGFELVEAVVAYLSGPAEPRA